MKTRDPLIYIDTRPEPIRETVIVPVTLALLVVLFVFVVTSVLFSL